MHPESPTPRLARAIFEHVQASPSSSRRYNPVIDWCKRQGWSASESMQALDWLSNSGFLESYERTNEDWVRVAPGAGTPEGEAMPGAPSKAAPKASRKAVDEDAQDDEDSEADEDGEADSEDEDESDEDSEDDDQDEDEEEAPESEEQPEPRRVPSPPERAPGAWLEELTEYLRETRTQYELGVWAQTKSVPYSRVREQMAEWRREGRLTSTGRAGGTKYTLDGAPLVRRPPLKHEEAPAKPEKQARRAPAPKAKRAPRAKAKPCGKPSPIENPRMPACQEPTGHDGLHRSQTRHRSSQWDDASSGQRVVSEDDPIAAAAPPPMVVLQALARLPGAERAKVLEQAEVVGKLAARVEQLEGELVVARAELEAALRGEAPKAEAPKAEAPAMLARVRAAVAAKRGPKPGRSTKGGGASIGVRALAVFRTWDKLTAPQVAERLGTDAHHISPALSKLVREGKLERPSRGVYQLPSKGKKGRAA
jgi:outer membrane murein-binding lipoprotein Lpp